MGAPEPPAAQGLLIADISGYTRYISRVEIDHAQDILADLLGTVVTSLRPTFRLSKLEGDAAFCFAPADTLDGSTLLDTVEHCYFRFRRRRRDVQQATSCECAACLRIPELNLKFAAHHGQAVRQRVADHDELLGADVVLVHRLLKNAVVERLGVSAYLLLTAAIARAMAVDPDAIGMRPHREVYEHFGELELWVHDLETRWQEEDARRRVYVGPDDALFAVTAKLSAPPQVVWEFVTAPGRRRQWQGALGVTAVEEQTGAGGRRGVGTTNHCMHGADANVEEILDWRPFDYFTDRTTMPGGAPAFLVTMELEPTRDGTLLHFRAAPPERAEDRAALAQMAPVFEEALRASFEVLSAESARETETLLADRAEPPLPRPRADGALAEVPTG